MQPEVARKSIAIIRRGDWLTHDHIIFVNHLLKKQFPDVSGLSDPKFVQDLSFPVSQDPFIQMFHVGEHWMTVAGVSPSRACVYDSTLYSTSTSTKAQIAAIMNTKERRIELTIEKTQFQRGGSDCGLFAIAYATDLSIGNNPAAYRYDQGSMRPHLIDCLEKQCLTTFRSQVVRPGRPLKELIDVHCSCRLPEGAGDEMVECMTCGEWYHKYCEGVHDEIFTDSDAQWKCT